MLSFPFALLLSFHRPQLGFGLLCGVKKSKYQTYETSSQNTRCIDQRCRLFYTTCLNIICFLLEEKKCTAQKCVVFVKNVGHHSCPLWLPPSQWLRCVSERHPVESQDQRSTTHLCARTMQGKRTTNKPPRHVVTRRCATPRRHPSEASATTVSLSTAPSASRIFLLPRPWGGHLLHCETSFCGTHHIVASMLVNT